MPWLAPVTRATRPERPESITGVLPLTEDGLWTGLVALHAPQSMSGSDAQPQCFATDLLRPRQHAQRVRVRGLLRDARDAPPRGERARAHGHRAGLLTREHSPMRIEHFDGEVRPNRPLDRRGHVVAIASPRRVVLATPPPGDHRWLCRGRGTGRGPRRLGFWEELA